MASRRSTRLSRTVYDLIVIGGGIHGAGVANQASRRGEKVLLLEKGDFASGTSSRSSKLIHGGLRYLEQGDWRLVREALEERWLLCQCAPHLVWPLEFIFPVYFRQGRPWFFVRWGVALYHRLSGRKALGRFSILSADEVYSEAPELKTDQLQGGVIYTDAQMDDARLCLENVLQAAAQGAEVRNYTSVQRLIKENGKTVGVEAYDYRNGKRRSFYGKRFVCAVGPWTNEIFYQDNPTAAPRVRPTKGVHLVFQGQISQKAFVLQERDGRRIFFVIPWRGSTLVGTTDTDFDGLPDEVSVTEEDRLYLKENCERYFPGHPLFQTEPLMETAGLRPLVAEEGSPSSLKRGYVIEESYSGVVYVYGGKYTLYRRMAEEVLKKATGHPSGTRHCVYGSWTSEEESEPVVPSSVSRETVEFLKRYYGSRYMDVVSIAAESSFWAERLSPGLPDIRAQVRYAREKEWARTPEDVVVRRLGLPYRVRMTAQLHDEIQKTWERSPARSQR